MKFNRSWLSVIFLALFIGLTHGKICDKQNTLQINLSEYKIPKTNNYQFAFDMHQTKAYMRRNENGTFFVGNFSNLVLKNQQNVEFVYDSVQFNFECPALHKLTNLSSEILQLQITHKLRQQLMHQTTNTKAPYDFVIFSFPFMVSQFVPDHSKPMNLFLNDSFKDGSEINLHNIVKNLQSDSTLIYTTRHARFVDKSALRMVRKQLRLMSKQEFKEMKYLIEKDQKIGAAMPGKYKAVLRRPERIYEIRQYPFGESCAARKEQL